MTDRLVVFEDRYGYRIGWECDGDTGAVIGQDKSDGTGPAPTDRDAWEVWIASKLAKESGAYRDGAAFCWESKSAALAVLRAIKLQFRNAERPLPEWATTALAAGWKPPKDWRP